MRSHELLGAFPWPRPSTQSHVVSAPSIIATDSIPATMNVGQTVPVLTSSGWPVTGSPATRSAPRAPARSLYIMARVNSSGVVTMVIDQDVSEPQGEHRTSSTSTRRPSRTATSPRR